MIVVMRKGATEQGIEEVTKRAKELGFDTQTIVGKEKIVIGILGIRTSDISTDTFKILPEVEEVIRIKYPFKLASREFKPEDTIVKVNNLEIGGKTVVVMAGPCAVETEEQVLSTAKLVKSCGAKVLRGGAYKPSTSPFGFRGLVKEGLEILALAKKETGMPIITEVLDPKDVEMVAAYVDILQIGTRNIQNFPLLEAVGRTKHPVLLKRGFGSTIEEWLQAADYILSLRKNSPQLIICERGIRTFSTSTRFTLDISAVPVVEDISHLPIIIDPSHAAGYWKYVPALAKAGIAAGADGLLIEVHPDPKKAQKDGPQSLTFSDFSRLMRELKLIAQAIGREI